MPNSGRLSIAARFGLLAFGLSLIGLLCVAAVLKPSPDGYGTHTQLGLPPCAFRWMFGVRCPSCGMTTAWAHTVRGEWRQAVHASVGGFSLAVLAAVAAPWCLATAARGRPCGRLPREATLVVVAVGIVAITLIDWSVRILRDR